MRYILLDKVKSKKGSNFYFIDDSKSRDDAKDKCQNEMFKVIEHIGRSVYLVEIYP